MAASDAGGAERSCRTALRIAPDLAEAHANLGSLLEDCAALDEARTSYWRSIDANVCGRFPMPWSCPDAVRQSAKKEGKKVPRRRDKKEEETNTIKPEASR